MRRRCTVAVVLAAHQCAALFVGPLGGRPLAATRGLSATAKHADASLAAPVPATSTAVSSSSPSTARLVAGAACVVRRWVAAGVAAATVVVGPSVSTTQLTYGPAPAMAARPQNAASSAGSRVNKDAESLLRYGLPLASVKGGKEVRKVQQAVESISYDLRAKRIGPAIGDVETAKRLLTSSKAALVAAAPTKERAAEIDAKLAALDAEGLEPIGKALANIGPPGSPQEREALDAAIETQATAATLVSEVEARLVPVGYAAKVPAEYADLPRLDGRARVEFVLKKGAPAKEEGKTKFDIDGELFDEARVEMIVDGYTAPVTAGNFVDLVKNKFYDGMPIQRADGFVVQTGDGADLKRSPPRSKIPLEISLAESAAQPIYGETSEDAGKGPNAVSLPFQSYGALGMAREEYDPDSANSQFFFLLFDSDLTPAGKNFLDGRYACFGYTVKGQDFLSDVQEGDVIQSATLINAPPPFGSYNGLDP